MTLRRAAFLDRDGVLNEAPPAGEYLGTWDEFRWIPGAADGVARLQRAGYVVIVVSNQRGLARGLVEATELRRIERGIQATLSRSGASIGGFYYCPHELDARCTCRKPAPGLLLRAASDHGVSLADSVMIGDLETDVAAGRAAGCATVRVGAGGASTAADLIANDLAEASRVVARLPLRVHDARAVAVEGER